MKKVTIELTEEELKQVCRFISFGYWNHHLAARAEVQGIKDRLDTLLEEIKIEKPRDN